MARYSFNLAQKEIIDDIRSPKIYDFNLAMNLALLSNDASVIRRFFTLGVAKYRKDQWLANEVADCFLGHYEPGQAFTYFGLIPMIVQGKVNLIASNGFVCKSDDEIIDKAINKVKEMAQLEKKFVEGAYWESGIGDFAYRIGFDPKVDRHPVIDLIEPQNLEVNYLHGRPVSYIIKQVSDIDPSVELCEIHRTDEAGFACIDYKFRVDGEWVPNNDDARIEMCRNKFDKGLNLKSRWFPIKGTLIEYKQNESNNMLYRGERGVPDVQGLFGYEDALSEVASDLVDAIRKGGIKEYVSDELIPQDANGRPMHYDPFRKTIITTKGSSTPGESRNLIQVTQGQINWEAYTRSIQNLMSIAINKAGLSPTTLGITGLESINSSQESQDAREKPSLRKREVCLNAWRVTLKNVLNKWLQLSDYLEGLDIIDYTDLIDIQFNEYTNPSLESVTDVLVRQVAGGIKSMESAVTELNDGMSEEQVAEEVAKIKADRQGGITVDKNIEDNVDYQE